uniref:transposase n=1 Tax=Desulforadius tongensis TaxID=1216062 RepID=UPI00195D9760
MFVSTTHQFKSKIVLEILKEEKSISETSSEYGIYTTQLRRWKKETVERLSQLFSDQEKRIEAMKEYAEVGRLTIQLSWLKKSGLWSDQG